MYFLEEEPVDGDVLAKTPLFTITEEPTEANPFSTIIPEKIIKARYFFMNKKLVESKDILEALEIELFVIKY